MMTFVVDLPIELRIACNFDPRRTKDRPEEFGPQTERIAMAGMFELFVDAESAFRFRLKAPDGTVMAVSKPFDTKTDAVAGIAPCASTPAWD